MEAKLITQAFATLGHPGRLAVFRLLMRFAPQGVRPTEIAEATLRGACENRAATAA